MGAAIWLPAAGTDPAGICMRCDGYVGDRWLDRGVTGLERRAPQELGGDRRIRRLHG